MKRTICLVVLCLAFAVTGCINTATLPSEIKTGDIVNVGLGGLKRNSDGTPLTAANVTATITDDSAAIYNLTVVGLFRAYPDHTSRYAVQSLYRGGVYGELDPYDGQWWAQLQLKAPGSADPLPLVPGPATISIQAPPNALVDKTWQYEGSLTSIPVDIQAGTREPSSDETFQYEAYRHDRALTVNPDSLAGVTEVGGFQVKLTYNTAALSTNPQFILAPRLVPISHDPNINVIQHTVDNGDGTNSLIAMVTNPNGFVDLDGGSWTVGKSTFDDLRFAIVLADNDPDSDGLHLEDGWPSDYWLDSVESFYIDLNGDEIVSITPVLARSW